MPAISRIRFTNVIYENGGKRYNDEIFLFDGHNSAFLLENGGGKTVFIQTALQAIVPHINMADRKIKDTLSLENGPAHIAIEWIINESPRRYALTAVSLYIENNTLCSLKYVYDYDAQDANGIEEIPFSISLAEDRKRPATRGEIADYYSRMAKAQPKARVFQSIQEYCKFMEENYKIIPSEWRKVATINSGEGNVDEFFNRCKTTDQLLSNLLIPVVEEAIEGDHASSFVETFERQREHFKKNRILQEKIQQSRMIKEKIDGYVKVYKGFDKARLSYKELKGEAKTVTTYVENQLANSQNHLSINDVNHIQLKKDQRAFEQEKKSFDLYLLRNQEKELKEKIGDLEKEMAVLDRRYDALAARKQNIEWTVLNKELSSEESHLSDLRQELSQVDSQVEISDIRQQLEENACNVKGQFVFELALIERELDRLSQVLQENESDYSAFKQQLASAVNYEKDLIGQKSTLEAKVQIYEANQDKICQQLFGEEGGKSLSLEKDRIDTRLIELERNRKELKSKLGTIEQYIQTKTMARQNLTESRLAINETLISAMEKKKVFEIAMAEVQKDVEAAGYPLLTEGHIYSRESSIIRELEEKVEYAYQQKEKAINNERLRLRQYDQYENLNYYMSEPLLESIVASLELEAGLIQLGSQFVSQFSKAHNLEIEGVFANHPFWSLTLVVPVKHMDMVRDAVSEYSDRLTQFVMIISREEGMQLAAGQMTWLEEVFSRSIYPQEWLKGLEAERYYEWQQSLRDVANEAQMKRRASEQTYTLMQHRLEKVRAFFEKYPYETYETIKSTMTDNEHALRQVMMDFEAIEAGLFEDNASLLKVTENINVLEVEEAALKARRSLVTQAEEEGAMCFEVEGELEAVHQGMKDAILAVERCELNIEALDDVREETAVDYQRFENEKARILNLELYQEVRDFEPYGTNENLEHLKRQRQSLKERLLGISKTRQQIEDQIVQHEKLYKRFKDELNRKQHEGRYPFEMIDVYYNNESDELYDKIQVLTGEKKHIATLLTTFRTDLTRLLTRIQILEEALEQEYGGVIIFDVESMQIQQRLKVEKATLSDRGRKLIQEKQSIEKQLKCLELTLRELQIKDATFGFMIEEIVPLRLPIDYFEGFDEMPDGLVGSLMSGLAEHKNAMDSHYGILQKERLGVSEFCKENITDRRLYETVIAGLSDKNDYEDLLIYQEKMTEVIMKIIQLAEDDKRESDLELQNFLAHLTTYVKNVAKELDAIAQKTRISLEEEVKQIFIFDIPVWDEDEAKQLLRRYIDETILLYEKESNEDADSADVVRRFLSERLSVMSLLEVVLGERSIKIKCRKVSNDMKVNKAPMTWESSNKWSGGEKWSKNMTLFLSILNYLAEKKQYLAPHQKRQRSVILDNPFGKASSDHVLRPVFMIAEKLGFQIIALTAHAEGKFISEYFPVVYSCRLRATSEAGKQVMTNEKIVNHTYLREHSPMTIMRLQEVEQISLF